MMTAETAKRVNDFHVHSTESDGKLTPEEVIDRAVICGVSIIALCDHDTTAGVTRFVEYGCSRGLRAISGIEMSASFRGGNCHILGLGVSTDYPKLEHVLEQTRKSRSTRNEEILKKLAAIGISISIEQLQEEARGQVVARPHIAHALLTAGHVKSYQEAFDKYLSKGCPAYVDRFRLEPVEAVKLLRDAGAFVSLAHPHQLAIPNSELFNLMSDLKKAGMQGVEVYAPDTSDDEIALYRDMAATLKLTQTGGSDFHAHGHSTREIGCYRPNVAIPPLAIPELEIYC